MTWDVRPLTTAFKEFVTALIGVGIVAFTLVLTWRCFDARTAEPTWVGPPEQRERVDPYERAKDLLGYIYPLTGAVVGYYTGKMIADRSIDQANTLADQARSDRAAILDEAREGLDRVLEPLDSALGAGIQLQSTDQGLREAQSAARDLRRRLRRKEWGG